MKIFDNLPLMAKVALAPALVLLCMLVVALHGLWISQQTAHTLEEITQRSMVNVVLVAEAQERVVATHAMVMQSVASAGAGLKPGIIKALDQKIGSELKESQVRIDRLHDALAGDPEVADRVKRLDAAFKKYTKAALDTLDMKDLEISTAAVMMSVAESAYSETRGLLHEQFSSEVQQAKQSGEQVIGSLSLGNKASVALTALALGIGLLLTWFIARQIVRPLQDAVVIANDVADGNLSLRQILAGTDETGQVLHALGEVSQRLSVMIGNIRSGADQIDTAASEISIGNNDLASRTENTASALQATSSSVAHLANTIKLNAETAIEANQLAADAAQVAQQGGNDVGEVVNTMQAISEQARRISEIIGTIDGIAFQTNILALNAAVEAARAGEQGRGFAVVASEVRNLAKRSSDAAKEIRSLIGASVEQVSSGTDKVHAAGETMHRIVASISQVSIMVAEISRATAEQSTAIHGVNDAIADMDKNTQQNAALVEQSAAAAESLRVQAEGLVRSVSVFRVT